jgi:hypothetical protein
LSALTNCELKTIEAKRTEMKSVEPKTPELKRGV